MGSMNGEGAWKEQACKSCVGAEAAGGTVVGAASAAVPCRGWEGGTSEAGTRERSSKPHRVRALARWGATALPQGRRGGKAACRNCRKHGRLGTTPSHRSYCQQQKPRTRLSTGRASWPLTHQMGGSRAPHG